MTVPKMMFASGCAASFTSCAASLISKMPRFEPPWIDSSTPCAPSMRRLEQRRLDRELGGLDGAVRAARRADAHERGARTLHDRLDVGEVEVDETGGRDEVGDALHTGEEHLVGRGERLDHRDAAVADLEEPVVRHHDEGVDLFLQLRDARLGLLLTAAALERERLGHDADGERADRLRDLGDDGCAAGAGAAALAGGDEDHVGAAQGLFDLFRVVLGRAAARPRGRRLRRGRG